MQTLNIGGKEIKYTISRNKKTKFLKILVNEGSQIVNVIAPFSVLDQEVVKILTSKSDWIVKVTNLTTDKQRLVPAEASYALDKIRAKQIIEKRVEFFTKIYELNVNRIKIKNVRTHWGSCSRLGNLNFNYKLIYLPADLIDYVVVHEICHLKEFNHSQKFWELIGKTIPNYRLIRKSLKELNYKI